MNQNDACTCSHASISLKKKTCHQVRIAEEARCDRQYGLAWQKIGKRMTDTKQEQSYFKQVCMAFEEACQKSREVFECYYQIANYPVCLRFAGNSLVPLMTGALKHLAVQKVVKPALTLCLWDQEGTKTDIPPAHFCKSEYYDKSAGTLNTRFYSALQPDNGILSLLSCEENLGFYCVPSAMTLPYYETAAPLRLLFHWWLKENGAQLIHSGCIGKSGKGILLAGKGGSGKSTTTLACLLNGMQYLGDDYVILSMRPDAAIYSLYNSGKIHADNLQRLPALLPLVKNSDSLDTQKAIAFLYDFFPSQVIGSLPLHAILMPKITGKKETIIKKTSPATALMALAPSTIFQMAGSGEKTLDTLAQCVSKIPVFILELGIEAKEIANFLDMFIGNL